MAGSNVNLTAQPLRSTDDIATLDGWDFRALVWWRYIMSQSLSEIWLHIVFSTKLRQPWLREMDFRLAMFSTLADRVKRTGCVSANVGGYEEHVHVLAGLSRTITVAQFLEDIKSESSKWAKKCPGGTRDFS
jgi:putative transposase